jgi:hypothetical protein
MAKIPTVLDPKEFGLESFADLLPRRETIPGEEVGSFETFHRAMMATLRPATPYECVIAENLIVIEWEILQHRRMRDACVREAIHKDICLAVVNKHKRKFLEKAVDEAWEAHLAAGKDEDDFDEPDEQDLDFDSEEAERLGAELAERATSGDRETQTLACQEIAALGLRPLDLMSKAYTMSSFSLNQHEDRLSDLERRRREVKRDFDALQKVRPLEAKVVEAVAIVQ